MNDWQFVALIGSWILVYLVVSCDIRLHGVERRLRALERKIATYDGTTQVIKDK